MEELAEAKDILKNEKDDDLREMARAEIMEIEPKLPAMEENIKLLLILPIPTTAECHHRNPRQAQVG